MVFAARRIFEGSSKVSALTNDLTEVKLPVNLLLQIDIIFL